MVPQPPEWNPTRHPAARLLSGPLPAGSPQKDFAVISTCSPWTWPRFLAHRGGGHLAPENTLAAFREGWRRGWRAFECDVKLSADGELFLLHDDTLERTSNGQGLARDLSWDLLSRLDAGSWHSPAFVGEPPPRLEALLRWAAATGSALNLELKPNPGQARSTGERVGALLHRWPQVPALLSSFEPEALEGARAAAPERARGLLLEQPRSDAWELAQSLEVQAVISDQRWTDEAWIRQVHQGGWRALAYTVNEVARAQALLGDGLDGLFTDALDDVRPDQAIA